MPRRRAMALMAAAIAGSMSIRAGTARAQRLHKSDEGCTPPPDGFQCKCPSVNGLFYIACCPDPNWICECVLPPEGSADCVPCEKDKQCHNFDTDTWKCCEAHEECLDGTCKPYCKSETARGVSKVYDPSTQCCTKHGIQQKYPVQNLGACHETLTPKEGYKPTVNGCGPEDGPKFPDSYKSANFRKACDAHDMCYGKCGNSQVKCNDKFCKALMRSCSQAYPTKGTRDRQECDNIAQTYCDGVRVLGGSAFESAQSKACKCCP